tara:strand:- start:651 stop:911 length:261 start_codon:yes stop_codon:yes gene_type:complete
MEIPGMTTMDQTTAGHLWQAFTTLSDAQELLNLEDPSRANEEINHAKRHLHEVFSKLSDDEQRQAMGDAWLCTLNLEQAKESITNA